MGAAAGRGAARPAPPPDAAEPGMTGAANWREAARAAAYDAAMAEGAERGEGPFNYRWEHVRAVVKLAGWLARALDADADVVEAAAWLHDVRKSAPEHALAGAREARRILADTDLPREQIAQVADAIEKHEGLFRETPVEPLEAAILWDADKLSKLGATAFLHWLAVGYLSHDSTEALMADNEAWLRSVQPRMAASMNTGPARAEARRRLRAMGAFHAALARELTLEDHVGDAVADADDEE
ncbi:MAG: HD domain-containing protein [Anaerolineae bacterium]